MKRYKWGLIPVGVVGGLGLLVVGYLSTACLVLTDDPNCKDGRWVPQADKPEPKRQGKPVVTLLEGNTYTLKSPTPATRTLEDYQAASGLAESGDSEGLNQMKAQGRHLELVRGQQVIYRGCEGALCGIARVERVSDRQQFFIPRKSLTE